MIRKLFNPLQKIADKFKLFKMKVELLKNADNKKRTTNVLFKELNKEEQLEVINFLINTKEGAQFFFSKLETIRILDVTTIELGGKEVVIDLITIQQTILKGLILDRTDKKLISNLKGQITKLKNQIQGYEEANTKASKKEA